MIPGVLVDAGPLVAILNRRDNDHEQCLDVLRNMRQPLHSTWMPVTEAMYLLDSSLPAQNSLLEMIERGALSVVGLGPKDLPLIRTLMKRYRDLPMDFADATLVHVANRDGFDRIFTLDQRDFSIYKLKQGRTLRVIPA